MLAQIPFTSRRQGFNFLAEFGVEKLITAYRAVVTWLERFPDTPGFFERHFHAWWRQFTVLLLLGLLLRCSTFGDPNLHVDETFYFLVGQEMHHGAIPYVDIWDRKPIGLFLIYYAIAAVSTSVVAYQLAAWLFASTTAMVIAQIARRWAGTQGGLLAGASYLFMLGPQEGYGGQSPVFYNLLIAGAALLVLDARPTLSRGQPGWRTFLAMALAGLALTVKQTAVFEAVFFGVMIAWLQLRSGTQALRSAAVVLACATLGALPTVASGVIYYWIGHWPEFWQAMVTSNLAKAKAPLLVMVFDGLRMCLRIYPYVGLSWVGLWITDRGAIPRGDRAFLGFWIFAAMAGVLSVPNFYSHYALPLLVPLAITSSVILGRRDVGAFLVTFLAAFTLVLNNPLDRAERRRSMESMERMALAIRKHDAAGGLFVFDAPPLLYALSHTRPPTPLAFPHHLNHWIERDVSQFNTLQEVQRVLNNRPGAVAMGVFPKNIPANGEARSIVKAYVQNNCQVVDVQTAYEVGRKELIAIWGDCHEGAPDLAP